ncbi:hypothetical protein [Bacillus phage SDFMU_Pbc]|uniref:Uncharacterized protein n=1 Tax=Bacillus phage SDFMU_Pbc TaxID=3076135 RepID=A0AA96KRA8_9CAUD|nr:hypothetical protein [Bacillus phage SDFMU_Pbc]
MKKYTVTGCYRVTKHVKRTVLANSPEEAEEKARIFRHLEDELIEEEEEAEELEITGEVEEA